MRGCPFGGEPSSIPISFSRIRVSVPARVYSVSRRSVAGGRGKFAHPPQDLEQFRHLPSHRCLWIGVGQNQRRRLSTPALTRFCFLCFLNLLQLPGMTFPLHASGIHATIPPAVLTDFLPSRNIVKLTVKLPTGIGTEYPKGLSRQRNQKSLLRVYTEPFGMSFTWGKFQHWAQPKSTCHCISTEFYESSAGLLKTSRQMRSYLKMRSLEIS